MSLFVRARSWPRFVHALLPISKNQNTYANFSCNAKLSIELLPSSVTQAEINWPWVPTFWTAAILSAPHWHTSTPAFYDRIRVFLLSRFHASFQNLCESSQFLQLVGICRSNPYSWTQRRKKIYYANARVKLCWARSNNTLYNSGSTGSWEAPKPWCLCEILWSSYDKHPTHNLFSRFILYLTTCCILLLNCLCIYSSLILVARLTKKPWPNMKSHRPCSRLSLLMAITNNLSNIVDLWSLLTRLLFVLERQ